MASKSSADLTNTSSSFDSSTATSKDMIEVSSFYHRQWAPDYLELVTFRYDGITYQIRLRQHHGKVYFAESLDKFRKYLSIFESVIIKFLACNNKSIFDLYFIPSQKCQTYRRPQLMSRQYIWTVEITQLMLGAPGPLNIIEVPLSYHRQWRPYYPTGDKNTTFEVDAIGPTFGQRHPRSVLTTTRHIFIADVTKHMMQQSLPLRGYGKRQQWKITMHDGVPSVAQPWFQYLSENNLMPRDDVIFFFRFDKHVWEVVFRKEVIWDDEDLSR
ncbi:hypothetical protein JHK82_018970 [Glycine max]|nr:hypothetical protein JHK85_019408 [Glycine max]KAG5143275.1 hypothetical protein JHK82_018970 [Glycine max]